MSATFNTQSALLASPSELDAGGEHRRPGRDMRCLSAFAAILTVVAGAFFLLQGRPACPNGGALQDLPLPPPPPPPSKALLLALGVITAPGHFNRRVWMRQKLRVTEARRRGVRVLFVLGSQNHMSRKQRKAVRHEERAHLTRTLARTLARTRGRGRGRPRTRTRALTLTLSLRGASASRRDLRAGARLPAARRGREVARLVAVRREQPAG